MKAFSCIPSAVCVSNGVRIRHKHASLPGYGAHAHSHAAPLLMHRRTQGSAEQYASRATKKKGQDLSPESLSMHAPQEKSAELLWAPPPTYRARTRQTHHTRNQQCYIDFCIMPAHTAYEGDDCSMATVSARTSGLGLMLFFSMKPVTCPGISSKVASAILPGCALMYSRIGTVGGREVERDKMFGLQ